MKRNSLDLHIVSVPYLFFHGFRFSFDPASSLRLAASSLISPYRKDAKSWLIVRWVGA